ncbi:cytosine permease [Epidermidibacterium keratini]|uniref:Cytosine permease n=1 Tax=Epidermidibacterium keratini TaxID=1891644 RepID=A0A7L4YQL9_9ACTN|nr:cytosine permease [Epidermidibacterium keratini]QHC01233.1 cytosine permease [Epidermidibacterium keratini]
MTDQRDLAGDIPATAAEAERLDADFPLTPVPSSARKSGFSIMIVLLGFTVFTPTMVAGAGLAVSFTWSDFIVVLLVGSLLLGAYVCVIAFLGQRTGLTTVMMSRFPLGYGGSKLASVLLGGTQIGWYGVVIGTIGDMMAQAFGWESYAPKAITMIVVSAFMAATAYFGYNGMYYVSLVATPLILILAFWLMWRSLDHVGGFGGLSDVEPTTSMSFAAAVTAIVGTFVSAGTQCANWTRFARKPSDAVSSAAIAFFIGNGLMILFGAIGALAYGEGDFTVLLYQLGLVGWGIFFMFGNLWTSNADTAYAFGNAGAELFNKPKKGPFIIGGAVIGTALALFGVQNYLIDYLILLGIFIPPLGGVLIGDWLARWRNGQPPVGSITTALRWQGLVPYVVASALAYLSSEYGWGIAPVNGIIVAGVLAFLLARVGEDTRVAPRSP